MINQNRFTSVLLHVQQECLDHQKTGKKCVDCFYFNNKGPEYAHDCIWYRIGAGRPDTWVIRKEN